MYKFPASFDASARLTSRGARICEFETANLVLKEKRQGTEVRVRWITGESAGWEESCGYDRVMNETQIEEGTGVVLAKRVFGG